MRPPPTTTVKKMPRPIISQPPSDGYRMFTKWFKRGSQLANQLMWIEKGRAKTDPSVLRVLEVTRFLAIARVLREVKSVSAGNSWVYTEFCFLVPWNCLDFTGSQIHKPLIAKHIRAKEFAWRL